MDSAAIDLGAGALGYVRAGGHAELTLRQIALLSIICDRPGPHRVRDLAAELGVGKPIITRAIHAFMRGGLALRHQEDEDRRSVDIEATDAGQAVRASMRVEQGNIDGD